MKQYEEIHKTYGISSFLFYEIQYNIKFNITVVGMRFACKTVGYYVADYTLICRQ